jgi:hypothetical protein
MTRWRTVNNRAARKRPWRMIAFVTHSNGFSNESWNLVGHETPRAIRKYVQRVEKHRRRMIARRQQ